MCCSICFRLARLMSLLVMVFVTCYGPFFVAFLLHMAEQGTTHYATFIVNYYHNIIITFHVIVTGICDYSV